jgi:hypothetical protein
MTKKSLKNDQNDYQEGLREVVRQFDLGDGIDFTIGLHEEGKPVHVKYYFTNKVEGLKKTTTSTLGNLVVEYSSSQSEDNDLLHFLSQRVR